MKIKRTDGYIVLFIAFFLQPFIEQFIIPFKYFDELIVLCFFITFIAKRIYESNGKESVLGLFIIICLFLLLIVGICGNVVSQTKQPFVAVIQDILSNCKLFVFIIAIRGKCLTEKQKNDLCDGLSRLVRFIFVLMFSCAILSLFVNIGMTDYSEPRRYGLNAFKFIYNNAAGMNTYCYLFIIVHSITLFKNGKLRRNSSIYTVMGVISWILTLRSRAVAFAIIYSVLYIYIIFVRKTGKKFRFKWYHAVAILIGAVILGWGAIEKYFIINERVSRFQLMQKSFQIAKEYFPIGTGFGTYGTEASRVYYSVLYYRYNMASIYGLSPENPLFIVDQYWFGIIGQFGLVGLALISAMIYGIYREIWSFSKQVKPNQLAALTLFLTSVLASLTAGTFIQASILPSIFVLYLLRVKDTR